MNKVLLITNAFPPMLGGGVLRPSRLAKYLPEWGWEPIVLSMSVPPETARLGDPASQFARHIIRPPRLDPTEVYGRVRNALFAFQSYKRAKVLASGPISTEYTKVDRPRLSNAFLVPDPRVCWIPLAAIIGWVAILRNKPSAIFSMSPDPSAHLVAMLLKKVTGLRWVAEFRDPWIANPFRHPRPFRWMERFECWLEGKVLFNCDHLCVTASAFTDDFLCRYPGLAKEKFSVISNGFDPADFEGVVPESFDRFTILHAGNFYGARTAVVYLSAYAQLLTRRPDLRACTQTVFLGKLDHESAAMLSLSILKDNVLLLGERTHREAISLTCGADVLLLIPGPGKGTMPGKMFEYMRAARPIFCLGGEGAAADLIQETGAGVVETSIVPEKVAESLEKLLHRVSQDHTTCTCSTTVLRQFDRREIAGQIARVLYATKYV